MGYFIVNDKLILGLLPLKAFIIYDNICHLRVLIFYELFKTTCNLFIS